MTLDSEQNRIRFVGDIESEPEPLRSQLRALVMSGAAQLDDEVIDGGGPKLGLGRPVTAPGH